MLITTDPSLPYVVPEGSSVSTVLRAAAARIRRYGFYQGDWYPANIFSGVHASPFERECSVDAAIYLSAGCVPWEEDNTPQDRLYVPELALKAEEAFGQYITQAGLWKPVYEEMNVVDSHKTIIEWNDHPKRTTDEVISALLECAIMSDLASRGHA